MKKFLLLILFAPLFAILPACSDNNDEPEIIDPVVTLAPRTILVYQVANNSLDGYDDRDIDEMKFAVANGQLGNSRLLVYSHPRSEQPRLIELTRQDEKILKTYDFRDLSTSEARMQEVFDDMRSAAPARTYGLILWSHGSGWLQDGIDENTFVAPLSFGVDGDKRMNITSLAKVIEPVGFDYIYFDCCFMMSVEVLYQMRNCAPTIAGSTIELPADGMPYDLTLKYLAPEKADVTAAVKATFNNYDTLTGSSRTCAMSVVNTSAISELAAATRAIFETRTPLSGSFHPQEFMMSNLYVGGRCYLFDFGQYVEARCADVSLLKLWQAAMDKAIVFRASTPKIWNRIDLNHHSGLSTFILNTADDSSFRGYNELEWWTDVASTLFQ